MVSANRADRTLRPIDLDQADSVGVAAQSRSGEEPRRAPGSDRLTHRVHSELKGAASTGTSGRQGIGKCASGSGKMGSVLTVPIPPGPTRPMPRLQPGTVRHRRDPPPIGVAFFINEDPAPAPTMAARRCCAIPASDTRPGNQPCVRFVFDDLMSISKLAPLRCCTTMFSR
jgi:hypothetical protein